MLAVAAVVLLAGSAAAAPSRPSGRVAYVTGGKLVLLDVATGRSRVLVARRVNPPVRFSPDGRYLAYGAGETFVVATTGQPRPLQLPAHAWAWAPRGHRLAIAQHDGSVAVVEPGGKTETVAPAGWDPSSFAWSPDGRTLALGRLQPAEVAVWRGGDVTRVAGPFSDDVPPEIAAVAPDGRTVFWWRRPSASTAADGLPLRTSAATLPPTLLYHDWVAWCGGRLYVAAGIDRYATHGKRIVALAAPSWRPRDVSRDARLSWVAPTCAGGRVLVSAGRNFVERHFGLERRSVYVLSPRRRLTTPPAGATDESPRAAGDEVLFVRVRAFVARLELLHGGRVRELAKLGRSIGYYGHYDWASSFDWAR